VYCLTDPVGALLALKLTHTPFSASSALGICVDWVSVETAVFLVSYINKLRIEQKMGIRAATREASLLRLRPIMMTALVACLDCCRRPCLRASVPIRRSRLR